jgi:hypothetical protein
MSAELQAALRHLEKARESIEAAEAAVPGGWRRGPMPPNTYHWGGVVPKGMKGGFLFADFHGDHAVMIPGGEKVAGADVAWFNNSLELPPDLMGSGAGRVGDA